jgi:hypothetical protein
MSSKSEFNTRRPKALRSNPVGARVFISSHGDVGLLGPLGSAAFTSTRKPTHALSRSGCSSSYSFSPYTVRPALRNGLVAPSRKYATETFLFGLT